MGFGVRGLNAPEFGVLGVEFVGLNLGLRVLGLGARGLRLGVSGFQGLGFRSSSVRVSAFESKDLGSVSTYRVSRSEFRVSVFKFEGLRFRVELLEIYATLVLYYNLGFRIQA